MDDDLHPVTRPASVLTGATGIRRDEDEAGAAATDGHVEIATLPRGGGIVDPDTCGGGAGHVFHAQHTRPVLVGFGGTAIGAVRRVVLAGDAIASCGPCGVLHRQPSLKHSRRLNDGKEQEQQQRQGHGELCERLPLAPGVLSVLRVPMSSFEFHPYPPPLITRYPM